MTYIYFRQIFIEQDSSTKENGFTVRSNISIG